MTHKQPLRGSALRVTSRAMRSSVLISLLAASALAGAFAACSSSTSTNFPGTDSGTGKDSSSGGDAMFGGSSSSGGDDSSMGNDTGSSSSSSSSGGTDAMCSAVSTLHPPKGQPSIYCPFSGADGGPNVSCTANSQHCCEPTAGTGGCVASGTACGMGDTDWQCEDPVADCTDPNKPVCCAAGATLNISADPMCGNFATSLHGASCVATGACSGGIELCTNNNECSNGQMCTPFRSKGNQVGGCH
jgi:hypothetical protein